jgi:hypothetical protein
METLVIFAKGYPIMEISYAYDMAVFTKGKFFTLKGQKFNTPRNTDTFLHPT